MEREKCIFDMDGTLVDSMRYWRRLERDFLTQRGVSIPDMERVLELAKPLPLYQSVLLFIERFGLKDTPEQAMNEMISMMRQHYQSDVKSKPGAEEYLKKLKKCGVHMCIVTATPRHLVEVCLSRLNLTSYFDFLLSCDEVGAGKDHPDAFYEAAHRLGSVPSEIAVFEDSLQAAKTAKQAGFYTIGVYDESGYEFWSDLSLVADKTIKDWTEASVILK